MDLLWQRWKLVGFYNWDEKCLQRGTDWVFKWSGLSFAFWGLTAYLLHLNSSSCRTKLILCNVFEPWLDHMQCYRKAKSELLSLYRSVLKGPLITPTSPNTFSFIFSAISHEEGHIWEAGSPLPIYTTVKHNAFRRHSVGLVEQNT
jgi:hypothetical protein